MDANERLHHEWIGMAQPEGLVVTPAALKAAEANITEPVVDLQAALRALAGERKAIADLRGFVQEILGWSDDYLVTGAEGLRPLQVRLDGGELLAPTMAVRSADDPEAFVLLVEETHRRDLDAASDDPRWTATATQRFCRLLTEAGVPAGLLTNGRDFRLVYAPRKESPGWIHFRLDDLLTVDGRPLLGAFHMLLNERRLLSLSEDKRLGALLKASREYQNTVSTRLQEQILRALGDLLAGVQEADRLAEGRLLRDWRRDGLQHLQEIYAGLVTVLMRMVFILYAEEKRLLPMESELYAASYSLSRLYAQLAEDRARHGDTLDDRYGAWGRLITLFRLLHDGAQAAGGKLTLAPRKGSFFDPDAHPFLEGRPRGDVRQPGGVLDLPRVSDGVVYRALDRLLVLDGERLRYRDLAVEHIGSVYEGLMGFEIRLAEGDSLAVLPHHVVVDLEALLRMSGPDRVKALKEDADLELKDKAAGEVKAASTVAALSAALAKRASPRYAGRIARGTLYLQPGEERRRTGSHYTPQTLTQPIVETALRPVLERLGPEPAPEAILDLKVCDPAMGSGAFLVEACRQLADVLVEAWRRVGRTPQLPLDEDPALHARRLIAQRCLYGVDKNPLAVDLARLSLWLETFAREHPFTFVDHALRHGDSLVGLRPEQIYNFSFDPGKKHYINEGARNQLLNAVRKAEALRKEIHALGDPPSDERLKELWDEANHALGVVRTIGDVMVAAFFGEESARARQKALEALAPRAVAWLVKQEHDAELLRMAEELRGGERPVPAFHWEVEFPEVFERENGGFDVFVGNPPFLGGKRISTAFGDGFRDWLAALHDGASSNADLVAHFFRRCFSLLSLGGTFGLIATNTIAQGDTRSSGLSWIRHNTGIIYSARRRMRWPGVASVVVSIIHVAKARLPESVRPFIDDRASGSITAFLLDNGGDDDPLRLKQNSGKSFIGSYLLGMGFTFDDESDEATPIEIMKRLVADPRNAERVAPYIGGEEVNSSPTQSHRRYVINFGDMTEGEASEWPELLSIVREKVRPARAHLKRDVYRLKWWQFGEKQEALYLAARGMPRVLVNAQVSPHMSFSFQPNERVYGHTLNVFPLPKYSSFVVLQSRVHEVWARLLGSSMKDDLRYTPTDCFETFPFPPNYEQNPTLEAIGKEYYDFRAALMIKNDEGLTKTYNRFHDPEETSPDIRKLRDLHAQMDRAVLDAYGWTDLRPEYDFRPQLDESLRYTWADDTRDEVLARLLELNRRLAAEEAAAAQAAEAAAPKAPKKPAAKRRGKKDEATLELPMGPARDKES